MGYELSVRCDVGKGNALTKTRCHTDRQAKKEPPSFEGPTMREAEYGFERIAALAGWRYRRKPGIRPAWICPVCPIPPNLLTKEDVMALADAE